MSKDKVVKINPSDAIGTGEDMTWLHDGVLNIVVVGASGDLAKKKTFPSLLNLFDDNLLPENTTIWGYARSDLTDDDLRDRLRPFLEKDEQNHSSSVIDEFLSICHYKSGDGYGDIDAFTELSKSIEENEKACPDKKEYNRMFYFAIPPNVFADTAVAINKTCMQDPEKGFSRVVVEKPFGRDTESFEKLNKEISEQFDEQTLYRIDHFLGKDMVQNLTVLRFSNTWFERCWKTDDIQCVMLTFKEDFGTQGRGGYFDKYGIIRDVMQNHLMQILTLLAMEPPSTVHGPNAGKAIRDAKVGVLNAIPEVKIEDCVLGQYEGYADDPSIENKDTNTPTFAVAKLSVNTPRWAGVPFIMKAGKALNERKSEMRIQFKDAPAAKFLFSGQDCPRNELVMRLQPAEAVYLKTNVKTPGFKSVPIQSELEVNYDTRFFAHTEEANPDAYTRLLLDVLQGKHEAFVRDDELRRSWEIFTPLLHTIDSDNIKPIIYKQGSRGPKEADDFIAREAGYVRNEDYVFYDGGIGRKTQGVDELPASKGPKCSMTEVPESDKCDIGLYGLAVMGQNFALNMASHGFKVCVSNRSPGKVDVTVNRAKEEGDLPVTGVKSMSELIGHLKKPRKLVILVQAGKPVDETINAVAACMEDGDIIIDGGNEWFQNSVRRADFLAKKGIHFIGMGISGGEEGARFGPSLMPGGPQVAYDACAPIFEKCAAQVEATGPCVGYLGPIGSGNYVKMVHNGIEYGDMQLIAEVYDTLKLVVGMGNEEMADLFDEWNKTELSSYLIEITAKILRKKDDETGGYVVDHILDKTGQKGTGRWTIQEAAERNVADPTIASALDARLLSSRKEEREAASKVLFSPVIQAADKQEVIGGLRAALYASKICSYAQGMSLIKAASDEFDWSVDLAECARLWMGGCIIRAELLGSIREAFTGNPDLANLLVDPSFSTELNERSDSWRRVIALCITSGIACPSLSSSLTYFDSYRRARLPANLTQAQRDFFGGHTYERNDASGRFHTAWTDAHKDIGDATQRTAGEHVQK